MLIEPVIYKTLINTVAARLLRNRYFLYFIVLSDILSSLQIIFFNILRNENKLSKTFALGKRTTRKNFFRRSNK